MKATSTRTGKLKIYSTFKSIFYYYICGKSLVKKKWKLRIKNVKNSRKPFFTEISG